MSNVIKLPLKAKSKPDFLNSEKTKAEAKAYIAKGTTKAKTANIPAQKKKIAEKIKEAQKLKSRLGSPGELARCRAIVGGDMMGAALLYRMAYLYRTINPKLERNGKKYLALTRDELAMSAGGLTEHEMNKRALPRVRKYASHIVDIQAMGNGKDKKLWFIVDIEAYAEALNDAGYELVVHANEGIDLFALK
ncbi:hypothetical protein [Phyllobacterium phragmitis]|uniref:Uncharacterized protein n=1 Tax=Phyllobacterium phragmitis TaxID=2670329 RepID=A0ABQ0GYJ6_9HYPH